MLIWSAIEKIKKIFKHPLFLLFFLGLILRLSLIFLDYSFDVNNHISWAHDLWQSGFAGFFDKQSKEVYATIYPNYPPLSLFIFYLFYPLQKIIIQIIWWLNISIPAFPSNLVYFVDKKFFLAGILKLPAIFFDLATAWIIILFAEKFFPKNKKIHLIAVSLILFNPAFFYNSAYWGQIDVIPIFFVMASYYFLIFSKRHVLSGIFFSLAILVKPTVFVYIPIYIFFFIKKIGIQNFFKTFLIGNIIFIISFLPFLTKFDIVVPYVIYSKKILEAQSLPFATNGAFNFWLLMTQGSGIKDTASFLFGLSYRYWGLAITGLLFILLIYYSSRFKDKIFAIFMTSYLASFAGFLFLTKMHERYTMLILPFLLLASIKDKKYMRYFYFLSVVSFLNLYHSWPVPYIDLFAGFIRSPVTINSIAIILLFLFLFLILRKPEGA